MPVLTNDEQSHARSGSARWVSSPFRSGHSATAARPFPELIDSAELSVAGRSKPSFKWTPARLAVLIEHCNSYCFRIPLIHPVELTALPKCQSNENQSCRFMPKAHRGLWCAPKRGYCVRLVVSATKNPSSAAACLGTGCRFLSRGFLYCNGIAVLVDGASTVIGLALS